MEVIYEYKNVHSLEVKKFRSTKKKVSILLKLNMYKSHTQVVKILRIWGCQRLATSH